MRSFNRTIKGCGGWGQGMGGIENEASEPEQEPTAPSLTAHDRRATIARLVGSPKFGI